MEYLITTSSNYPSTDQPLNDQTLTNTTACHKESNDSGRITLRHPTLEDGKRIHQLITEAPPLDLNSSYLYFLLCSHFAKTCVIAEKQGEIVGFVSGYRRPDQPEELFVWQLVVAKSARGQGLAKTLVTQQIRAALKLFPELMSVSCTISPDNHASQGVFKSLAKHPGLTLSVSEFLTPEHFEDANGKQIHAPEDHYCLFSPAGQKLKDIFHDDKTDIKKTMANLSA